MLTLIQTLVVLTQNLTKLTSNGRGPYESSCIYYFKHTQGSADNAHSECFLLVPRQNCPFCPGFLSTTLSHCIPRLRQSLMQLSKMILFNHDTSLAKLQSPNHWSQSGKRTLPSCNHIHMFYTRHLPWTTTSTCSTQDSCHGQPHLHVLHKTPALHTNTHTQLCHLSAPSPHISRCIPLRPTWARSRLVISYQSHNLA